MHHNRLFCARLVGAPKAMSSKRLDSIADYSRHGYALRVDCRRCRRVAVLDPLQIVLQCQQRGWSKQMAALEGRLRCSRCGSRQTRLGPAFDQQQGVRDRL
jgi:tRNA G26 N,N-dimethylase Trm1